MKIDELNKSERIEQGMYLARVVIEILAKPQEYAVEVRTNVLKKIKEDTEMLVDHEYIAEPKEEENKFYSTFLELEIWFKDLKKLQSFCIDFLPSNIEVLEPENAVFKLNDVNHMLNDLAIKLHAIDKAYRYANTEKMQLNYTITKIIQNGCMFALKTSAFTAEQLAQMFQVDPKPLKDFLEPLVKKGKIKQIGDKYSL